jgi:hypothetical protein
MSRLHGLVRRVGSFAGTRPGLVFAATVIVFGGGALTLRYGLEQTAQRTGFDRHPAPQVLQEAITSMFSADRCIGVADAERMIASKLDELGLEDWTIQRGAGADRSECVAFGLNGQAHVVELFMALSPEMRLAIEALEGELLRNCYTKDDAAQKVRSLLVEEGLNGWEVRTDGPIGGPAERMDEIMRHVEQGCWIYSTTGWTKGGTRVIWLGGK